MAVGDLTLTLGAISVVSHDFVAYTPRVMFQEHRSQFEYALSLNPIIRQPVIEGKYIWVYTAIGSYTDLYIPYSKLLPAQRNAITAGTFTGITLTDEIDPFIEISATPTRTYIGGYTGVGDSAISYSAKFLTHMSLDFDRQGNAYKATVTLQELAKL